MRPERPGGSFQGVGDRACPRGPWTQALVWIALLPGWGAWPPHLNGWDEQVVSGTGCSQLSRGADPRGGTQEGAVSCLSAKPEAGPREQPPAPEERGPEPPSRQVPDHRGLLRESVRRPL